MCKTVELTLGGCAPVPLAHYLKALGVLRLISEQKDAAATGRWQRERFLLKSSLDTVTLLDFFLNEYTPTPVLTPWNGGSGFYPKDNSKALEAIAASPARRFHPYRQCIHKARSILAGLGLRDKPESDQKEAILQICRNGLPEVALEWLDAAFVLTSEGAKYPPLLGTGGNDGRLEFSNNFMRRLTEVIDPATGRPRRSARLLLEAALFGPATALPLSKAPVGQFYPGHAGGANATTGFDAESLINPWDFILMIEGTLLFGAAAVRRLQSTQTDTLAYPFSVHPVGAGYPSAAGGDEPDSRPEMWMPLWPRPATLPELKAILGEGRAQIGQRPVRDGVDFARAIVTLGVDRGLSEFQRFGFQLRNGRTYFAIPLGRFAVRRYIQADLLSEVDAWLDTFRRIAAPSAKQVPASVLYTRRQVEESLFALCREGGSSSLQALLLAMARAEKALARSYAWTTHCPDKQRGPKIRPLSGLSGRWLREAYDGSVEFRLAASLASVTGQYKDRDGRPLALPLRCHLEPVAQKCSANHTWLEWDDPSSPELAWRGPELISILNRILARRLVRAVQSLADSLPDQGLPARLSDLVAFIEGRTNDTQLTELLWALAMLDWHAIQWERDVPWWEMNTPRLAHISISHTPPGLFSLLRLVFPRRLEIRYLGRVPIMPVIHRHVANGNGADASQLAARRLRASGQMPAIDRILVSGSMVRRCAAALLFPLRRSDLARLRELILKPEPSTTQSL